MGMDIDTTLGSSPSPSTSKLVPMSLPLTKFLSAPSKLDKGGSSVTKGVGDLKREIALCLSAITTSDRHSSIPIFFVAPVGTTGGVTNLISRPEAVEKRPK